MHGPINLRCIFMFPTTMSRLCFRWTIVYISCCENSISCITNHCVRFLCYWPWCPCSVLSAIVSLSVFRVSTFVSVSCVISLLVHILLPHIVSIFCVTSHRVHILCYLTSYPHSVLPHVVSTFCVTSHRVHILCYLTSCPHSVLPHIVSISCVTSLRVHILCYLTSCPKLFPPPYHL